jgi:hypothetical protein
MARCSHCGAAVKARSKSCEYCGARVEVGAFESVIGLAEDRFKQRDATAAAAREAAAERERTEAKNRPKVMIGLAIFLAVDMLFLASMSWNERQWATATTIIISGCVLLATLAIVALIVWQVRRPKTWPVPNYQAPAQPAPNYQAPAPVPIYQTPAPPAGWYPDPTSRHQYRYWSGNAWATTVCNGDAVSEDPI